MEGFAKNNVERSILDVWQSSEYASGKYLGVLYYFRKTLYLRSVAGLLIRFFKMNKDLVAIILRERKKIAGGFIENLLLVHRPNQFRGIPLTQ